MVPGPPGPHATGIPHPAIVNPQIKHEPLHETDIMHMWVLKRLDAADAPLPSSFADFQVFARTPGEVPYRLVPASSPSWFEQISSRSPPTADNRPRPHSPSGITAHLTSKRSISQISAGMIWIHVLMCVWREVKWAPSEVVIADISIIHGHRGTEDCTINKRVSTAHVLILGHFTVDEVWLPLLTK